MDVGIGTLVLEMITLLLSKNPSPFSRAWPGPCRAEEGYEMLYPVNFGYSRQHGLSLSARFKVSVELSRVSTTVVDRLALTDSFITAASAQDTVDKRCLSRSKGFPLVSLESSQLQTKGQPMDS